MCAILFQEVLSFAGMFFATLGLLDGVARLIFNVAPSDVNTSLDGSTHLRLKLGCFGELKIFSFN